MATTVNDHLPLIVIVGPTASGKTALAIQLAQMYDGEIIAADSRTVYAGMDIGTAKPTRQEQAVVPHWGIDLVTPGERFTASQFQSYANHQIAAIRQRGHVPFLVGGTGLYIDSVLFDFQFPAETSRSERVKFDAMTIEELHKYCKVNNIPLPENYKNKRYVINTIMRNGQSPQRRRTVRQDAFVVGIATDRETLRQRITTRTAQIFDSGVIEEARELSRQFGWDYAAMTGNVYPIIRQYLDGDITLDEAKAHMVSSDWHLAKRQMTWFRRHEFIQWGSLNGVHRLVAQKLAPLNKS